MKQCTVCCHPKLPWARVAKIFFRSQFEPAKKNFTKHVWVGGIDRLLVIAQPPWKLPSLSLVILKKFGDRRVLRITAKGFLILGRVQPTSMLSAICN